MMTRPYGIYSGFSVEEAEDGLNALTFLKERKPDIVILDFMLPGMDGISVCSELRIMSAGEHVPVLMITGLNDIESIEKAIIALANSLNLKVVAEGVETDEQFRILSKQGCCDFQGFLYSPAIPAADMTRLLIKQNSF